MPDDASAPRAGDGHDVPAAGSPPPAPACTLVVFGAHGDLTRRLLTPALTNLAAGGLLADAFRVLGVDHNERSDEAWREELEQDLENFPHDDGGWDWLRGRLDYFTADFTDADAFHRLAERLQGPAVFYLAVAARFFGPVIDNLAGAGLLEETDAAFRRIVIEKPFGEDLATARALNRRLLEVAEERQIFRIDHYLGKETVQNIMALRFANGIFEPLWRRDHIDHVQITAAETVGVGTRGGFYETTGALRDMVPNHLFQLLAMTTMEPPVSFDADAVRAEKAKAIQAIKPIRPEDVVRGQYAAGEVDGERVPGYRDEGRVPSNSRTETYVAMRLSIDTWRWADVPFYLRTGKRMGTRRTEVAVRFRQAPIALFRDTPVDRLTPNVLRLNIQPREGLTMALSAKLPGPQLKLSPVELRFRYEDAFRMAPSTGYETLIYDCLVGDAMLFQRADNIEAGWGAVDAVLRGWERARDAPEPYAAGSFGPRGADAMLARDRREWLPLD